MKMYILVCDILEPGLAITAVAHASLAMYLKFKDTSEVKEWLDSSFKKVVCKVSAFDFDKMANDAVELGMDHVVLTESALGGARTAIAFAPREEWPKCFKYFPLWK